MSRRVALQPAAPRHVSFSFPAPGELPSQVRWRKMMQGLEARHGAKKRKSSKPRRLSPKAARRAQIRSARHVEASFLRGSPRRPAAPARVKTTRRTKKQRQGYQKKLRGMTKKAKSNLMQKTLMELMREFPNRTYSQRFHPKVSTLNSLVARAPGSKRKVATYI